MSNKVVQISQAEYYSQVHLTPKPVHSLGTDHALNDGQPPEYYDPSEKVSAVIPLAVQ